MCVTTSFLPSNPVHHCDGGVPEGKFVFVSNKRCKHGYTVIPQVSGNKFSQADRSIYHH